MFFNTIFFYRYDNLEFYVTYLSFGFPHGHPSSQGQQKIGDTNHKQFPPVLDNLFVRNLCPNKAVSQFHFFLFFIFLYFNSFS